LPDLKLEQGPREEPKKPRKRKPSRKHQNQMLLLIAERLKRLIGELRELKNAIVMNVDLRETNSKEIYNDLKVIYGRVIRIQQRLEKAANKKAPALPPVEPKIRKPKNGDDQKTS
jgi:DNA-directed RNA polymerase specialized sigma subunit